MAPPSNDNALDDLLPTIGGFGIYQVYILFMISLTAGIINPSIYMSFIFAARQNDHRCNIPECDTKNSKYLEEHVKYSIPERNGKLEKCKKYRYIGNGTCEKTDFDTDNTESCSGWVYQGDEWTILHEFNMQCPENTIWFTLVGVINNLGQVLGLYSVGYIADRFGRRLIKVYIMLISGAIGVSKCLYVNYWWFLLMEFLDSLVGAASYICGFVLVSEIMPVKWRSLAGNIVGIIFSLGACYLALIAYLTKHWWYIILIVHLPSFLVLFYLWLIPESIRWNLINNKKEKAKVTLRRIAKINGKELKEEELDVFDNFPAVSSGMVSESRLKSALRSRILLTRLMFCMLCWFANNFVYYGMIYNSVVEDLSDNMYMDFALQSVTEVPAYFVVELLVRYIGRKKSLIGSYGTLCAICTVFIFVPKVAGAKRILWMLSKFFASIAPGISYIYTNELFPTYLRQAFMGTCSSFGKIGAMLAPVHRNFAEAWIHLPLILYAGSSGLAMLLVAFFFPETKDKKLPDTVHEAEAT